MTPRSRNPFVVFILAGAILRTAPAAADGIGEPTVTLGVTAGMVRPDPAMADYRWDVGARPAWGAKALIGVGRLAGGLRTRLTETTQGSGVPEVAGPVVQMTSLDLVLETRLATVGGADLRASGSAGRLHLAYEPHVLRFTPPGGTGTVEVGYEPIDEWALGAGLIVRRRVTGGFGAGLAVEHRWFALDTAHRRGDAIVVERRGFGDWSADLEISWRITG